MLKGNNSVSVVGGCGEDKERRCGGGLPGSCAAPVFEEEGR